MNSVNEKVLRNTSHRVNSVFSFEEHEIRTVMRDGEPWFFAIDVCKAIALDNTAIRKLDDDEKGLHSTQTLGGMQEISIISESGLYTLILRCRNAVKQGTVHWRFRKWVTNEVLPSIRKSGQYTDTYRSSRMGFISGQSDTLEFRDSAITQLNALFACADALRNDLWPHLSALFPGLKSEYGETFTTLAMVSGLLKHHKKECKMMAERIMGLTE